MPVVFCSNHESNVDPAVLFQALHPQLHILYKAELHKFPLMGTVLDVGGFVPVDRRDRRQSFDSLEQGSASLRAGNSFLIFPEGTRSRTGDLLPFKKGGFIMAIQAQVPIVPVAISGGRAAMRKGSAIVRPVRVSVRIGAADPHRGDDARRPGPADCAGAHRGRTAAAGGIRRGTSGRPRAHDRVRAGGRRERLRHRGVDRLVGALRLGGPAAAVRRLRLRTW